MLNKVTSLGELTNAVRLDEIEGRIASATEGLLAHRQPDGHWCFELEADATIPAEYVLMRHYRGEPVDAELERKIAVYLRRIQGEHGGWPLFHDGGFDMSASVKAYFALKMIGDDVGRAAYGQCPRRHPGARRRGQEQCLHQDPARALRQVPWRGGPDHAGRDHAAAALVPVPPDQGVLLGAHGHGAAVRAAVS